MARKKLDFDNPLISAISTENEPTEKGRPGRPRREDIVRDNSPQEGLTAEYTRFSVICKTQNVKDLKDYAYTKRIPIREAIDVVMETFFDNYRSNPENEELLDHTRGKK